MTRWASRLERPLGLTGVILSGAIFGFFYAWVCSTMWGLDDADPRVAIEAMQAMNASVRNAVFVPAFFLTPVALGAWALALFGLRLGRLALMAASAALVYTIGGLILTMALNVPMNEDLADTPVPADRSAAQLVWDDYSGPWQTRNQIRAVASGVTLTIAALTFAGAAARRRRMETTDAGSRVVAPAEA